MAGSHGATAGARPRILFLARQLGIGGVERQLLRIVTGINRERYEPVVWCDEESGAIAGRIRQAGIDLIERRLDVATPSEVNAAIDWLKNLNPAVLFIFSSRCWVDTLIARMAGIRHVVCRRAGQRAAMTPNTFQDEEAFRNEHASLVIALCETMRQECLTFEALPPEKVRVIFSGIEIPARPRPRLSGVTIGNVANYSPNKGQILLLEALCRIQPRIPQAKLVIGGRTSGELDSVVEALSLGDSVRFLGEVHDPSAIYSQSAVYAHASYSEGLPNAVLEAMAFGLPVVTTAAGGVAEAVVHGETGFVVDTGDSRGLTKYLRRLLNDVDLRRKMGAAGRARARQLFHMDRLIRDYESLIEDLLASDVTPRLTAKAAKAASNNPAADEAAPAMTLRGR